MNKKIACAFSLCTMFAVSAPVSVAWAEKGVAAMAASKRKRELGRKRLGPAQVRPVPIIPLLRLGSFRLVRFFRNVRFGHVGFGTSGSSARARRTS